MPAPLPADPPLAQLRERAHSALVNDILPFWEARAFRPDGHLVGAVRDDLSVDDAPDRHAVIAARVLWTFSAAAQADAERHHRWLATAHRAYDLLVGTFWDHTHGGVWWSVDADRRPVATRKQVYAQAFAIYGLARYAAATGLDAPRERALELFALVEEHSRDRVHGGYVEAHDRDWGPIADTALSAKDLSVPKSMNTNLHVLEAYTTLAEVTGDARAIEALHSLLDVTLRHIVVATPWATCALFFDDAWVSQVDTISYGHDIEASWLLWEAAEVLDAAGALDESLRERTRAAALDLADAVAAHGADADGGVLYEGGPEGPRVTRKHWWPQAEGVVGWLNAWQLDSQERHRDAALAAWRFADAHIIDHARGEWFAAVDRAGTPLPDHSESGKIGPWKCPYHNGRACLEIMRRVAPPL